MTCLQELVLTYGILKTLLYGFCIKNLRLALLLLGALVFSLYKKQVIQRYPVSVVSQIQVLHE